MDKVKFHPYQLVGVMDLNNVQEILQALAEALGRELISIDTFVYSGMVLTANDPSDMSTNLTSGIAWKNYKRIVIPDGEITEVNIPASDPTNGRIDLLSIKYNYLDTDEQVTNFKNPTTKAKFTDTVARKTIDSFTLEYTEGTPSASPVAPSIPTGNIGLYTISVGAGVTSITDDDLTRIAPSKPDFLVGSHRTENPIDHPDACIFDVHISPNANISLFKLNGLGYSSLKELIDFSCSSFALPVKTIYSYNVSTVNLETVTCAALGIEKRFYWNTEDGSITRTETENATRIFTKHFTFNESGLLTETDCLLEIKEE